MDRRNSEIAETPSIKKIIAWKIVSDFLRGCINKAQFVVPLSYSKRRSASMIASVLEFAFFFQMYFLFSLFFFYKLLHIGKT